MADPELVRLRPWIDFSPELAGYSMVGAGVNHLQQLCVLGVSGKPNYRSDDQCYPRIRTEDEHDFLVLRLSDEGVTRRVIPGHHMNMHIAEILPGGELLLAGARARFRGPGDFDLNALVFTEQAVLLREFSLGDGIEQLQVSANGDIWVRYFDEGIGGSLGWRHPDVAGAAGLVCWDSRGRKAWELRANEVRAAPRSVNDTFALNVVSPQEVWAHYATLDGSPLIRVRERSRVDGWITPSWSHSGGLAVKGQYVLMGNSTPKEHCVLLELKDTGECETLRELQFLGDGEPMFPRFGRGEFLYFLRENTCFRIGIADLIPERAA